MFIVDGGCYLLLTVFSRTHIRFVLFYSFYLAHNEKNDDNKIIMIIKHLNKNQKLNQDKTFSHSQSCYSNYLIQLFLHVLIIQLCAIFFYYFLTKDDKNRGKIKIKNPKITKKIRKMCHRVGGYHHSNKIHTLFCKMFSRSILQNGLKVDCYNFLRDQNKNVGSETWDPNLFNGIWDPRSLVLFHDRQQQFCHLHATMLGLIHCVEHKAKISKPKQKSPSSKASFSSY